VTSSVGSRVAKVLVVYAVIVWLVLFLSGWLRRVLALPPIFETLAHGALVLGLPIAIVLAWHYPALGQGSSPPPGP
jgi:hypothetical protein